MTSIDKTRNYLVSGHIFPGLVDLQSDFCGIVCDNVHDLPPNLCESTLYLCGDVSAFQKLADFRGADRVFVIREYTTADAIRLVDLHAVIVGLGQVPVIIHGVGVYFRQMFENTGIYQSLQAEHKFQALTESTKPWTAHRKGIYLTKVEEELNGDLRFRLLRCSSNLDGPTENLSKTDHNIINLVNREASYVLDQPADVNHVLAQTYENKSATETTRATKGKIKAHSDKTKDMNKRGILAFCTFYDNLSGLNLKQNGFDYCYKKTSALTSLLFRRKPTVLDSHLPEQFSVKLYPGSILLIPLETNWLYTHEIRPSILEPHQMPTRMGYVGRCSATEAIYQQSDNQVYIEDGDHGMIPLQPPTEEGMILLRKLYADENQVASIINYPLINFSMNNGDYLKPIK